MKLYVVSYSENGTDSIDGCYCLVTEQGEYLASHWCSCKGFAKGDLYTSRPDRIKEYESRFGSVDVLHLGEDDMTIEKLLDLNRQWAKMNGLSNE